MEKLMYTSAQDGGLSIVIPAPRESLERVLGPLTEEEYEAHVWERSIPEDAINPRYILEGGLPPTREFRDAWVDVTPEAKVDIDLAKAKELKLKELRVARDIELRKTDVDFLTALSKGESLDGIKARKQVLRDATNPLKALSIKGPEEEVLNQIRLLSVL